MILTLSFTTLVRLPLMYAEHCFSGYFQSILFGRLFPVWNVFLVSLAKLFCLLIRPILFFCSVRTVRWTTYNAKKSITTWQRCTMYKLVYLPSYTPWLLSNRALRTARFSRCFVAHLRHNVTLVFRSNILLNSSHDSPTFQNEHLPFSECG